jgi:hypothetical protein
LVRAFFFFAAVARGADFLTEALARDFIADFGADALFGAAFLTAAFLVTDFLADDFLMADFLADALAGALFRTAFLGAAAFFFIAIRSLLRSC